MSAHAVRLSNVDIDNALKNKDFEVLFQPIFDLGNGALARVESFIRWRHATLGVLPPGAFISFFETQGRMGELTRYVLENALDQYLAWRGPYAPGFSINLAMSDLTDDAFVSRFTVLLRDKKFPAEFVTLECPMPGVDAEADMLAERFAAVRETGARLAIEVRGRANDYLREASPFPFHEIKTGGAAILRFARTVRGPGLSAISELLEIAERQNAAITAVGVEDQASLSALKGLGFVAAQGNHLGRVGALDQFKPSRVNEVRTLLDLEPLSRDDLSSLFRTQPIGARRPASRAAVDASGVAPEIIAAAEAAKQRARETVARAASFDDQGRDIVDRMNDRLNVRAAEARREGRSGPGEGVSERDARTEARKAAAIARLQKSPAAGNADESRTSTPVATSGVRPAGASRWAPKPTTGPAAHAKEMQARLSAEFDAFSDDAFDERETMTAPTDDVPSTEASHRQATSPDAPQPDDPADAPPAIDDEQSRAPAPPADHVTHSEPDAAAIETGEAPSMAQDEPSSPATPQTPPIDEATAESEGEATPTTSSRSTADENDPTGDGRAAGEHAPGTTTPDVEAGPDASDPIPPEETAASDETARSANKEALEAAADATPAKTGTPRVDSGQPVFDIRADRPGGVASHGFMGTAVGAVSGTPTSRPQPPVSESVAFHVSAPPGAVSAKSRLPIRVMSADDRRRHAGPATPTADTPESALAAATAGTDLPASPEAADQTPTEPIDAAALNEAARRTRSEAKVAPTVDAPHGRGEDTDETTGEKPVFGKRRAPESVATGDLFDHVPESDAPKTAGPAPDTFPASAAERATEVEPSEFEATGSKSPPSRRSGFLARRYRIPIHRGLPPWKHFWPKAVRQAMRRRG